MSSGLTMYQCFQLVSFLSRNQQVDFELSFLKLQQPGCSLVSLVTPFNYSLNIQWCLFCMWTCLVWIDRTNKFQKNSANYLFTDASSSRTIWGKVHNKEQWKFGVLKETYSQNWVCLIEWHPFSLEGKKLNSEIQEQNGHMLGHVMVHRWTSNVCLFIC